ncbi:MAG: hypothetical protein EXR68_00565 [Dehalococcoidia bacterium]|nr:hypothetical protein [Dehalococcoidia bacterium]
MLQPPLRLQREIFYGWAVVAVSFWDNWITAPLVGFLVDSGFPPSTIFSVAGVLMAAAGLIFLLVPPPNPSVRVEAVTEVAAEMRAEVGKAG